jgi:hypothetical protein
MFLRMFREYRYHFEHTLLKGFSHPFAQGSFTSPFPKPRSSLRQAHAQVLFLSVFMHLISIALALIAYTAAVGSAHPITSNASASASAPSLVVPSNASLSGAGHCFLPIYSLANWWYNTRSDGPYSCKDLSWAMRHSYRSGGIENVHWKYEDNPKGPECIFGWEYYAEDGKRLIARIEGRTTNLNSDRYWCALPVYRSGGVRDKQWEYCECWGQGRRKFEQ